MLVKTLGIIDVITAIVLMILGIGFSMNPDFLIILGVVMLLKASLGLFKDFGSWIDIFSAIILFVAVSVNLPGILEIVVGILVLQKGIVSFF